MFLVPIVFSSRYFWCFFFFLALLHELHCIFYCFKCLETELLRYILLHQTVIRDYRIGHWASLV